MFSLKGYCFSEKLYESNTSIIFRGKREFDHLPIVVKILKKDYPTYSELDLFKYEYRIARKLELPGVIKVYDTQNVGHSTAIIMEDFGGVSLDRLIKFQSIDLKSSIEIIISITETLGRMHQQNFIFKNINPQNIIVNLSSKIVKLIDFGIATEVKSETQSVVSPEKLEGNLAYISPEQTGRINRCIDFRSDFYSLGVTFYEMLTNRFPFEFNDPLELIHCHIARRPIPPYEIRSDIPLVLSNIVMKLLSKTAEIRYQSAWGLKSDLEECYGQIKSKGKIENFGIAKKDMSEKLEISEKLYGREAEVKVLFDEFTKVIKGNVGAILFNGPPGIGKSYLINEIHEPLIRHRGYFISGKFDQHNRDIPYSGIIQAFSELMKQILTETKNSLEQWKDRLLEALGSNGQVIINIIPELELIIGKQPPIAQINPMESQNRFNLSFLRLIEVFTKPSHPLVLFIDDLQWADSATLNLIKFLLLDSDNKYLLFIGAYRDIDVDHVPSFMKALDKINGLENVISKSITLKPLELNHINQLISDTLYCSRKEAEPLSQLVKHKTQGNSFFVVQLLYTLYLEGILRFDFEALKWKYDLEAAWKMNSSDNVIDLMVKRLKSFSKNTQYILQLCSCIGSRFDLNTLLLICNDPYETTIEHLWEAVKEGFILPLDKNYRILLGTKKSNKNNNIAFKFLHDRVQQACYSLIPEEHKKAFHVKIGRSLLSNIKKGEIQDKIFDTVNQYNQSLELITDDAEKIEIAKLNLDAGKKAKKSLAYKSSLNFLTIGTNLLEENKFNIPYNLMFSLYKERAEVEYLNGNFEQAKVLLDNTITKAKTNIDKSQLYMLMIVMYTMSANYDKAIEVGVEALNILGINLPIDNLNHALNKELSLIKDLMENVSIQSLINNQEMETPEKVAAMKLLTKLAPTAYLRNHMLWSFIAAKRVHLSIEYGDIAESAHSYTNLGILLTKYEEYQAGYEFGLLGLKVSDKYNDTSQKCRAYFNLACFLTPWVKHMSHSDSLYEQGIQMGLKSGELQFVGYMFITRLLHSFRRGKKLYAIEKGIDEFLSFNLKTRNQSAIDIIFVCKLVLRSLTDISFKDFSNSNEQINEKKVIERCEKNKSSFALCYFFIMRSEITYLYGEPSKAIDYLVRAEKLLPFTLGTTISIEYNFYYSLSLTSLYKKVSPETQKQYQKQLEINQNQMRVWTDNCNENFLHKYLLVEAELANISCQYDKAMDLYDKSIESAKENGFIQNQALANELAAKFFLTRGRNRVSSVYMKEAYYLYDLWGAKSKIRYLEERYNSIFLLSPQWLQYDSGNNKNILDMNTVIKASQAISREIELNNLLEKLLRISLENSGTEKGFFIMESGGKLVIKGELNNNSIQVTENIPLEEYKNISKCVVNYVARTKEYIVLDDAYKEGIFIKDPYIVRNQSKSILCMPIICRGNLIGIGYLENNLSTGAFTANHIEVLKILFSQAAISIENAIMYNKIKNLNHDLEATVSERTKRLNDTVIKLREEISERKKAELELKESEQRYRLLVELLPDGVLVHDNFDILYANEVCANICGIENAGDLLKKTAKDFVHPEYHKVIDERLEKVLNDGTTVPLYELKIIGKDGTMVDIESISTLFPYKGKLAVLSVIRDITDRKQAEKLRKSIEDKERLLKEAFEYDRVKTEFIANISHELRTPLNVMLGAIQMFNLLFQDDPNAKNSYKITKYSNMMKQNCYRLIRLVNNLIDITKIDSGYFQINLKQCNIASLVENITLSVAEYIKDKGIKLIFDTDVEEKIMTCDPDKMERILLNLISNAIKFTDNGDSILVDLKDTGKSVIVSVKDTGIGIPEDKQNIIFDRFVQADKSLSRNNEGSGIGLSLVKSLVELQNGTISLESTLGNGSKFIIDLPVQNYIEDVIEEIAVCDNNKERIQIEFSDIYF